MANQYSGSLEHIAQERYGMTAREFLEYCAERQVSYLDAQDKLGVSHGTIRKWARRFGLELQKSEPEQQEDNFYQKFFANEINTYNLLSRPWGNCPM